MFFQRFCVKDVFRLNTTVTRILINFYHKKYFSNKINLIFSFPPKRIFFLNCSDCYIWYGSSDTCQMTSLESFLSLSDLCDQDSIWGGSPTQKLKRKKVCLKLIIYATSSARSATLVNTSWARLLFQLRPSINLRHTIFFNFWVGRPLQLVSWSKGLLKL